MLRLRLRPKGHARPLTMLQAAAGAPYIHPAQSINAQACTPWAPGDSGGSFSILFGGLLVGDTVTCGNMTPTVAGTNFGGARGSLGIEWSEGAAPGFADDLFSVNLNVLPSVSGPGMGFLDDSLHVMDPNHTLKAIQLDSNVSLGTSAG